MWTRVIKSIEKHEKCHKKKKGGEHENGAERILDSLLVNMDNVRHDVVKKIASMRDNHQSFLVVKKIIFQP